MKKTTIRPQGKETTRSPSGAKLINFYEKMPKKLITKARNPHKHVHGLDIPFRMCICGGSGSMKSNTILNVIHVMPDTWDRVVLICKNAKEPLYVYLKNRLKDDLEIIEGIDDLPEVDSFDISEQTLMIFDDLVLESSMKQKYISEYFVRARKVGVSCIYCTQSWYRVPIVIRQNLTYIILKKIGSEADIKRVLKDYSLGVDADILMNIYKFALQGEKTNFLLIDIDASEENKFRKNFDVIKMKTDESDASDSD
jgi:hypothetical protein